jgi:hypothetical protein
MYSSSSDETAVAATALSTTSFGIPLESPGFAEIWTTQPDYMIQLLLRQRQEQQQQQQQQQQHGGGCSGGGVLCRVSIERMEQQPPPHTASFNDNNAARIDNSSTSCSSGNVYFDCQGTGTAPATNDVGGPRAHGAAALVIQRLPK